jgi:hypothetical protein
MSAVKVKTLSPYPSYEPMSTFTKYSEHYVLRYADYSILPNTLLPLSRSVDKYLLRIHHDLVPLSHCWNCPILFAQILNYLEVHYMRCLIHSSDLSISFSLNFLETALIVTVKTSRSLKLLICQYGYEQVSQ